MTFTVAITGLCLLYVFWVLIGYPLWLSREANRSPSKVAQGIGLPAVTAIIPVYNGGAYLAAKLDSILHSNYPPDRLDVLVLSDGSTDGTDDVAQDYVKRGRVRFLRLPRGGKSAAINEALGHTDSEILLFTDVRQTLDPACVTFLAQAFHDPEVGAVSGNLLIRAGKGSEEANIGLYWRYESWIRSNLARHDSLMGATGPIYAMRRHLARPIPPDCLLDDVWLPMQAVLSGFRSVWEERAKAWDYPTTLHTEFNRKVRTQAGVYQLLKQEPRLLTRANRLRGPFITLKLGRLFLPHVLLLLLATSMTLPSPAGAFLVGSQTTIYGLALADLLVREKTPLKRLTAPARAFVTLLAATFCAQRIFFVAPGRLWKVTFAQAPAKQ